MVVVDVKPEDHQRTRMFVPNFMGIHPVLFSLRNTNVNLMVALQEKTGSQKSEGFILWGT